MKTRPNQLKFSKQQKGKSFNRILSKVRLLKNLSFGYYGLQILTPIRISSIQLERVYMVVNKLIKRSGRFQLLVFPHTPLTKKPTAIRMGKGKGAVDSWIAKVAAGTVVCSILTRYSSLAVRALYKASTKIACKTRIIKRIK